MKDNRCALPQSIPGDAGNQPASVWRLEIVDIQYLASYLFGIALCVLVTPTAMVLINFTIALLYPFLAVVHVPLFYLYLAGAYYPHGDEGMAAVVA